MPQVTFRIRTNIPIVRQGLEHLRGAIPKIGRKRLRHAAEDVRDLMQVPGKPIVYPVPWDSNKQKKAFFASGGFGHGIPTVRTDRYISGWKVVQNTLQSYTVINSVWSAKYIGGLLSGLGQSRIHAGRWPLFRDAIDAVVNLLPKAVVENLRKFVARGVQGWASEDSETE